MGQFRETISRLVFLIKNLYRIGNVWACRHLNLAPSNLPVLIFMVTDKCNLKCRMCGACDHTSDKRPMLSLDEWKAVIRSAVKLKTKIISITGGEPLLKRDLFEIIRYARDCEINIHLNSNGTLLSNKIVDELREAGVDVVSISLHSADKQNHESVCGAGTYQRTIDGIRNLRRHAPEIHVGLNTVIHTGNFRSLHEMISLAQRLDVQQLKFAPIHTNLQHKDKPLDEYDDMIFRAEHLEELSGVIRYLRKALARTDLQSTSKHFFKGITNYYRPPDSNFFCYAGFATCVINYDGMVSACFDKEGTQNVREKPLEEIWKSREFNKHRQFVRKCGVNCWETTSAEVSHRFSIMEFLLDPVQSWGDLKFYFGRRRPKVDLAPAPEISAFSGHGDEQAEDRRATSDEGLRIRPPVLPDSIAASTAKG